MYAIDKIEGNLVIAENIETKEKITVKKQDFPFAIHEGLLFTKEKDPYVPEEEQEKNRLNQLREKMERLIRLE